MKWRASTAYIEPVSKLLKSLQLSRGSAQLCITKEGIKVFTFSPSRSYNAQLFLDAGLFATFSFDSSSELKLTLSLNALVHVLQMFMEWSPSESSHPATPAGCFFDYSPGSNFQISFAYDTMNSICDLTIFDSEGNDVQQEIDFCVDEVSLQVIMSAPVFAGVLRDLDAVAAKEVSFAVNPDLAQLEIRAVGELATTEFVLPNEPSVLDAISAEGDAVHTYDFKSLAKCREAVKLAKRVSLRFDSRGVLSIQCLCEIDEYSSYIELRFLAKI